MRPESPLTQPVMKPHNRLLAAVLVLAFHAPAIPAAQAAEAPYELRLMRLGEILGSLHYLRNLCGEAGNRWREQMESLMSAENPPAEKRALYVAGFNRGYRAYASIHVNCTPATAAAIDRFMKEGEALARDTAATFGN